MIDKKISLLFLIILINIIFTLFASLFSFLRVFSFFIQTIILPLYCFFLIRIFSFTKRFSSNIVSIVSPSDGYVVSLENLYDMLNITIYTPWYFFLYSQYSPITGRVSSILIEKDTITIIIEESKGLEFFLTGKVEENVIQTEKSIPMSVELKYFDFFSMEIYIFNGQLLRKGDLIAVSYFQSKTSIFINNITNKNCVIHQGQRAVSGETPILL